MVCLSIKLFELSGTKVGFQNFTIPCYIALKEIKIFITPPNKTTNIVIKNDSRPYPNHTHSDAVLNYYNQVYLQASSLLSSCKLTLKQKFLSMLPYHPLGHEVVPPSIFSIEQLTVWPEVSKMVTGSPGSGFIFPASKAA